MSKRLKSIVKAIVALFIVLLVLIVAYVCIVYHNLGIYSEHYRSFCPSSLINTKWVCQEENIYFITYDEGEVSSGMIETKGCLKPFDIYFPLRLDGFGIASIRTDTGEQVSEFGGKVEYSEGICILTYNAEDDKNNFWGEKTGQVTLTFLKEELPEAG